MLVGWVGSWWEGLGADGKGWRLVGRVLWVGGWWEGWNGLEAGGRGLKLAGGVGG